MKQTNNCEKELIKKCLAKDRAAQKKLYELYASKFFMISMRYCKTQTDAEDVLQDAFVKIFDKLSTFKGGEYSFEGWMKRILVNTALNHNRGKMHQQPLFDVESLHHPLNNESLEIESISLTDLISLIQSLPPKCQTIFNLHAIEGYQHNEISKMLDITEGTSKSQFARAKSILREKIAELEFLEHKQYAHASGR
jgi:RNA polymerase sigma-70 factor (ECF subfamily)